MTKIDKNLNKQSSNIKESFFTQHRLSLYVLLLLTTIIFVTYLSIMPSAFRFSDISSGGLSSSPTFSEVIKSLKYPMRILTNLSFAANHYLFGEGNSSYFIVNVILHIMNSFLLFLLTIKLLTLKAFKETDVMLDTEGEYYNISISEDEISMGENESNARIVAFITALLFAVHPIGVYSVTNIAQRATLLCSLFYFLSLITFINYKEADSHETEKKNLYLTIGFSLLALFSKEAAVTVVLMFFMLEILFFAREEGALKKNAAIYLSAFALIALVILILPSWFFSGPKHDIGLVSRILTQSRAYFFYLSIILLPLPDRLSMEYDIHASTSLLSPATISICILAVIAFIVIAVLFKKRRPFVSLIIFWYFISLLTGVFQPFDSVYLHRAYIAVYAVSFAFGYLALLLYKRVKEKESGGWRVRAAIASFSSVVILLSYVTVRENRVFRTRLSLWEDALITAPEKESVLMNLGSACFDGGRYESAETCYKRVIENEDNDLMAHYHLGDTYLSMKRYTQAEEHFKRAIELDSVFVDAYVKLGDLYIEVRRYKMAIEEYLTAVALSPDDQRINRSLADVYFLRGESREALKYYLKLIEFDYDDPQLHFIAAGIYEQIGENKIALKEYEKILEIDIDFEHIDEVDAKIKELVERF